MNLKTINLTKVHERMQTLAQEIGMDKPHHHTSKQASVIIPIVAQEPPSIIVTKRAEHLTSHAGQMSFPGGRKEKEDTSSMVTALREAREEIGLTEVEPLGSLGTYHSLSGFSIDVHVGLVHQTRHLFANPDEVEKIYQVPMSLIRDKQAFEARQFARGGKEHTHYALTYQSQDIWGFTGTILFLFGQSLFL